MATMMARIASTISFLRIGVPPQDDVVTIVPIPRTPASWQTGGMDARADLARWAADRPASWYDEPHVRALNRRTLDAGRLARLEERAAAFGAAVAGIGELVRRTDARRPELDSWDGAGNRVERVVFDAAYHETGRVVWRSGVVADTAEPGRSFEQATLLYLLSHEGEMGHGCPVTCTVGLIRSLRRRATPEVVNRFLPALASADYDAADRGAQFLTEVQGGSDVGANVAAAAPAGDGTWRISGEKWFCSVADADQFLVTARPEGARPGTAGLGCFLVPRHVDGAINGFRIRRLKDKLGTRAMASAEIDFEGAVAWPIGPIDEGFKTAVSAMLNSSRWLNAVGNTGILARAYAEASSYARHRQAFGVRIGEFPAVRAILARMKLEWLAALHSTWLLTGLDEAVDTGAAADDAVAIHRFLVNANKYLVSTACTRAVHDAIELLGGNGAIESFSVLPRLLRDSVVYEQWEGTHNVLAAQVRRDLGRLGLAGAVLDMAMTMVKSTGHPELEPAATAAGAALDELSGLVQRCIADDDYGAYHFRGVLGRMMRAVQGAALLQGADAEAHPKLGAELRAAADLFVHLHLDREYAPHDDPAYPARVGYVLGRDAG